MKKNVWEHAHGYSFPRALKILVMMKLTLCLILLSFFGALASETYSQTTKLSLDLKNTAVKTVLDEIENQSDFFFLYSEKIIDVNRKVSIDIREGDIEKILDKTFEGTNVSYSIKGRQIVLTSPEANNLVGIGEQQKSVSGKVTDSSGAPLPGVTVVVKGTTTGIITDADGKYSLNNIPANATLVFSFVGMKSQEIAISGNPVINVTMEEEAIGIEEVVAIGYGTVRKSDLTGSVSKVTVENAAERSATSIEQLLQGQMSGVQITQNTGALGSGMTFSIRGVSSLSGSSQPLIVIDGYPIDSDNSTVSIKKGAQDELNQMPANNALTNLNPGDIESVEILKDASSAAIYGSRASNGVVLITTKRGKKGEDKVSYNYRSDISNLIKKIDVLNSSDYLNYVNESYLNSGRDSAYTSATMANYLQTNSNWQDLVFESAYSEDHQLSLSGGNEKMKYAVSAGYLGQNGIVKNSRYDRGSIRVTFDREINKNLKFGVSMSGSISENEAAAQSSNYNNSSLSVILGALFTRPFDSPYTAEDELNQELFGNPLTLIELTKDKNKVTSVLANMFMTYTIAKGLTLKVSGGANTSYALRDFYHPRGTTLGNYNNGYAYHGESNAFNYLTEYTLSYNRTFNQKHRIDAVTGYTWQEWERSQFGVQLLGFPNDNLIYYDLSSATSVNAPSTSTQSWALSSFIGRCNYSYDNKYLFTFTGRGDGSTRLGEGNKWDFFPSFALGWNLHNEKFMKSLDFISSCKIRASYGFSGSQSIEVGATQARLRILSAVANQSIVKGYLAANLANPNLRWETTKQINIGVDLALFKNRLTVGAEYYNKLTQDLLMAFTIPSSNGFSSYNTNQGSIENQGYEFDLKGMILTKGLKWNTIANISFNRNKVIDLGEGVQSISGASYLAVGSQSMHIAKIGYPIGSYYGYRIEGIYQNADEVAAGPTDATVANTPGSFKFKDISGPDGIPDGKITSDDREIIGNPYPDFIFGITNNFEWKRFSLSVFIQGSIGQDVINANRQYMDALCYIQGNNVRQEAYDHRWTGEGTSNVYPKVSYSTTPFGNRFTDFIVEDASFIRIKNVTFTYDLPVKNIPLVKSVRLYTSAGNLFTFTNYKGYDPEINSRGDKSMNPGVDFGSIPVYKTVSFGVNVGFQFIIK